MFSPSHSLVPHSSPISSSFCSSSLSYPVSCLPSFIFPLSPSLRRLPFHFDVLFPSPLVFSLCLFRFPVPICSSFSFPSCLFNKSLEFVQHFISFSILFAQTLITSFTRLPPHVHPPQTFFQLASLSLKSPSFPRLPLGFIYISISLASPHHSPPSLPGILFFLASYPLRHLHPSLTSLPFSFSSLPGFLSFFTSLHKLLTVSIRCCFFSTSLSYFLIITNLSFSTFFLYHFVHLKIILQHINILAKESIQYVFVV